MSWNTQQIRDTLEGDFGCKTLAIGNTAWSIITVGLALYTGGVGAGLITALKSQYALGPNGLKAAEVLAGCFEDNNPIEVFKEVLPLIGTILELAGITPLLWKVICDKQYIATHYKDKNFDEQAFDDLVEACYPER